MKISFKHSIIGAAFAFMIATSCCWLPALIIGMGGAGSIMAFSDGLEKISGIFMAVGSIFLGLGFYQYYQKGNVPMSDQDLVLKSVITCPNCGHKKEETMPIDACQYFYDCENCKSVLKPTGDDCCVYCSYGTVPCPPIQQNKNCC